MIVNRSLSDALEKRATAEREYRASWKSIAEYAELTSIPITENNLKNFELVLKINDKQFNFTDFLNKIVDRNWENRLSLRMRLQ